jgi:hypoxanthine phosphoribosyltransferase
MTGSGSSRPWKGLDTSRMPVFLGYDQIERMVAALSHRAEEWRPDEVVGIARGGLVPAAMAAGILALPLSFLEHDKTAAAVTWMGRPASGHRILLVDDCCSTGRTLHRAREVLRREGRECLTLVVVHDPDVVEHPPDLSHPMRELFRLPWERGEATPAGRAAKATGTNIDPSAEAPFTGLGVDAALLGRIAVSAVALPSVPADRAVLIGARPLSERARDMAAFARTAWRDLPLDVSPPAGTDPISIARCKAEAATRFGCTHFIDCDPGQAIAIAGHAPHLIVTWWSIDAATGWTIGAAEQLSTT